MISLKTVLEDIESGRREIAPLAVTYDDLHPFWGGLLLTIHGNGEVEQKAIRATTGESKRVTREELLGLVRLLLSTEAWDQLVPESTPVPDESRTLLKIHYEDQESVIWERHNDLQTNQRIIHIRDAMFRAAWISLP